MKIYFIYFTVAGLFLFWKGMRKLIVVNLASMMLTLQQKAQVYERKRLCGG